MNSFLDPAVTPPREERSSQSTLSGNSSTTPNIYTVQAPPPEKAGAVAGIPGRDGRDGLPGKNGERGNNGLQGVPGPQGILHVVEYMPITNLSSL